MYTSCGSGFSLEKIDGLFLVVHHYTPMGSLIYIEGPTSIARKNTIINTQNLDEQCFKWAIYTKHVEGEQKYGVGENYKVYEEKYDFSGSNFPTPLYDIKIFEKKNPDIAINVYGLEKCKYHANIAVQYLPTKNWRGKTKPLRSSFYNDNEKYHYT